MGRPYEAMMERVVKQQEHVEEYLWKLFAYHKYKPDCINEWEACLNRVLWDLRLYNIQKGNVAGKNVGFDYLFDKLVYEPFESTVDTRLIAFCWYVADPPFPFMRVTEKDRLRLVKFATRYVNLILAESGELTFDPQVDGL